MDSGKMTFSTEKAKRPGLMAQPILATTRKERNMDMGSIVGMMAPSTMDNGLVTKCQASASTTGVTVDNTKGSG
jgi:hypothetical protein